MISQDEMILRLVLAAILGGLIGLEREASNRPAGLRTHILVSLGSALLMLVSMFGFQGGDPARLAAQVVSGIGFLGAGTILREGNNVRGLTTAASLCVSGGIGLAIGNGMYFIACFTGLFVLFALITLGFLEIRLGTSKYKNVRLMCKERIGLLADIGQIAASNNTVVKDIRFIKVEDLEESDHEIIVELKIAPPDMNTLKKLLKELSGINGVQNMNSKNANVRKLLCLIEDEILL
jgi:putative Mg2+ transporter-C (MgtC) family protein